jgi:HD-GYP domain-containing protein (c-di-GMP phosphodiesterase class II)
LSEGQQLIHPALVVDVDDRFVQAEIPDLEIAEFQLSIVCSLRAAKDALENREQMFSSVFVNPAIGSPAWLQLVKSAHRHRPGVPIFLISEGELEMSDEQVSMLGIQRVVKKPVTFTEMRDLLLAIESGFSPTALKEISRHCADEVGIASKLEASEFIPIRIDTLLGLRKSLFDTYVALSPTKFVKILKFGDELTRERLLNYVTHGVTRLYIKKEAQEHFLNYCDLVASKALEKAEVSSKLKIAKTMNYGEQAIQFIEKRGVNDANMKYARRYVEKVQALVESLAPSNGLVKEFMSNFALYDHGIATSIVAGFLVREIGIESKAIFEISGLTVMLHDLGLVGGSEAAQSEDPTKMSTSELEEFHLHPARGAKTFSELPGIPRACVEAIEQHHMRLNKLGFPKRTAQTKVNRMAELIGVSDEFVNLIMRSKTEPKLDPLVEMETRILSGFSEPVATVFRNVFIHPQSS